MSLGKVTDFDIMINWITGIKRESREILTQAQIDAIGAAITGSGRDHGNALKLMDKIFSVAAKRAGADTTERAACALELIASAAHTAADQLDAETARRARGFFEEIEQKQAAGRRTLENVEA